MFLLNFAHVFLWKVESGGLFFPVNTCFLYLELMTIIIEGKLKFEAKYVS